MQVAFFWGFLTALLFSMAAVAIATSAVAVSEWWARVTE